MNLVESLQPKVEVVIPTFNRAKTVSRAIDSVLKQTYPNINIILVDDGSTDNTREVLRGYENIENISIIYLDPPASGSASAGRNLGILLGNYNYISFLDSDDEYVPEKIQLQVDEMLKPALPEDFPLGFAGLTPLPLHNEVDVCLSPIFLINPNHPTKIMGTILELFYPYNPHLVLPNLSMHSWTSIVGGMFRRELFETIGGFKLQRAGEDSEFKDRIISLGANIRWLDKPLYKYYQATEGSLADEADAEYEKRKEQHRQYEIYKKDLRYTSDLQQFIQKFTVPITLDNVKIAGIHNPGLLRLNVHIPMSENTKRLLTTALSR